jgi:four helix bundle protein
MESKILNFKDLRIWKQSIDLSSEIYLITKGFPKDELFGLTSQMRRCSISVASSIAEGFSRNYSAEFKRFLAISKGSLSELETQLIISERIGLISNDNLIQLSDRIISISKQISALNKSISDK